ncbi:MAG TPA: adenylate/guanylate cyclase domain-containing protein [Stellaceae bacterium]|nr:adenylate/guanylate cyclase domain-containing protein [Stellaceae bacterium]
MPTEYIFDISEDALHEQRRRRRLWARVGVPIAAVILVAAVLIGIAFYSYEANRTGVLGLSDALLQELQERIDFQVEGYLEPAVRATQLVRDMAVNTPASFRFEVFERLAMNSLARLPEVDAFYVADPSGNFTMVQHNETGGIDTKVIRNTEGQRQVMWIRRNAAGAEIARDLDPNDTYDPRTRSWYTGALETDKTFWTSPYIFFSKQIPGITASTHLSDPSGNSFVFGVDISLKAISDFLASLNIGQRGRAVIIDNQGVIIAMADVGRMIQRKDGQFNPAHIDQIGDAELTAAYDRYRVEGYGRRVITVDGKRIVSIVAPLAEERAWKMIIVVPQSDFTGFVRSNTQKMLVMSLVAIGVVAALATLLVRQGLRTDRAARLLLDRSHTIERESTAFATLVAHPELFDPTQQTPPHVLTEVLADVTSARRASALRLIEGTNTLRCEDSYDRESGSHVHGYELSQSEAPNFFSYLATGEELELANAADDYRTAELHRIVMHPLGSRALTVLPVRSAGHVLGAICLEDAQRIAGTHDFLRAVANMLAIRMATVPSAARHREEEATTAVPAVAELGERNFAAELAVRGIEVAGLAADVYPSAAVMVLKFGDPAALATRVADSDSTVADTIASTLQQVGSEHGISYMKMVGSDVVAAAGWLPGDTNAMHRVADTALAMRESCLKLLEDAGLAPSFRIGLDCGIAIGGGIGHQPRVFNLWGEALTTAEAMAASTMPGAIQATASVHSLLARDCLFRPRGSFYLPRVGSVQTFILASRL